MSRIAYRWRGGHGLVKRCWRRGGSPSPQAPTKRLRKGSYYYLLRHTRLVGKETSVFGIATLAVAMTMSDTTTREAVRSMDVKGCIKIEHRSMKGHLIRLLLPSEIPGLQSLMSAPP